MRKFILVSILILLNFFNSPIQMLAETKLDFYMNDFYSKSNEASQILKEIENNLKEGSRKKVCSRQREAARLGLLANKPSLAASLCLEHTFFLDPSLRLFSISLRICLASFDLE